MLRTNELTVSAPPTAAVAANYRLRNTNKVRNVQAYFDVTLNTSFHITNIYNGATLSGAAPVTVFLPNNAYEYGDVALAVDGTQAEVGGDLTVATTGGRTISISLPTDDFTNGSHTISVTDRYGNSDSRTVIFSNTFSSIVVASIFDTVNSDGEGAPTSCQVTANLAAAQSWTETIETTANTPSTVRTFTGSSNVVNVIWDGKSAGGVEVSEDVYTVKFQAGASPAQTRPTTKHKIGDAFLLFQMDDSIFPGVDGPTNFRHYKNSILQKLQPYVTAGHITRPSVIAVRRQSDLVVGGQATKTLSKINAQLRIPLRLFYVNAHGGVHRPMPGEVPQAEHPYFSLGGVTWFSIMNQNQFRPLNMPMIFDLSTIIAPANYGSTGNDPPGIVWIDCCKSAGGNPDGTSTGPPNTSSDDFDFAEVFHSGDLFGIFMGWNGNCINYGAWPPPNDDWTFWRLAMWTNMLNMSYNYTTAFNRTVTDYRAHGYGPMWPYTFTPEYRARITGNGSDNF
jgi:hypothetical protein